MKDNSDKHDRLMSEIMKDFRMESPSAGFTERVMENIQADSRPSFYRPLIGKYGWIGIAAGFIILVALIFAMPGEQAPGETDWLTRQLSSLNIPAVDFSSTHLFSWMNFNDPTLFWILTGITGLVVIAFLQRLIANLSQHRLYNL